ncbi:hypothetical protein L195_g038215 [Trifolium pratense]|uniref:Uncharacterized protein n=1 Tax=Trifolium pratense TaxID=57577 RepID=A0A2K3LUI0_TRIPR|nr:hypothetical protein L195_g038215 [Trifolium pratense]
MTVSIGAPGDISETTDGFSEMGEMGKPMFPQTTTLILLDQKSDHVRRCSVSTR